MDEQDPNSLSERVARLEKTVEALQRRLDQRLETPARAPTEPGPAAPSTPRPVPTSAQPRASRPEVTRPSRQAPESTLTSEFWLKLIGIGLVLFGVAFLFKYSIDRGWLTEPVRVGIGLALATGLLAIGLRLQGRRPHFSQVLLGGGIAAYYITGFAAFQLYRLVSHPVAFSFMVLVTLLAFFLSLRQRETALSIVATAGGLGTPFLLYTGAGNLPGLVAYTCVVLSGTSAIYLYQGWRSLLWTSAAGGWIVLLVGRNGIPAGPAGPSPDVWSVQVGILFGCLAFWAIPVLREILRESNPARWPVPELPDYAADYGLIRGHVHLLSVSTPLIALALSRSIPWALSTPTWGWVTLGAAALYGFVAWSLKRCMKDNRLAYTQALVGLLLLTLALCQILKGHLLIFALAAEATTLHLVSRRLADRGTAVGAHLLFLGVSPWLAYRLFSPRAGEIPLFNAQALTDLAIVAAALASSGILRLREERLAYRLVAHLAILGWIFRELSRQEGGQGYITVIWGIYAAGLLIAGLRLDRHELRLAGMGTLLLVVTKLFLVDLDQLEAIWRILLFLGFGGLFLVLSYYFRALWKPGSKPADKSDQ